MSSPDPPNTKIDLRVLDVIMHEGASIVTWSDIVKEFMGSHHAKAGRIMGSLDNVLAKVVEGNKGMITPGFPGGVSAAAVNGCWQCHGSQVKVLPGGERNLDPAAWPNTGIGLINPAGSEGGYTVCHSRHPDRQMSHVSYRRLGRDSRCGNAYQLESPSCGFRSQRKQLRTSKTATNNSEFVYNG